MHESFTEWIDNLVPWLLHHGLRIVFIGVLNAQLGPPNTYMIYGVGIAEQHRGQGHGKVMMRLALTELFKEADTLTLEVESTNEHAITLYANLGFKPVMQMDYHRLSLK